MPPSKGRNSVSFRMTDETCLDPWKCSKWSLNAKANVIVRERRADGEGNVIWGEKGEGGCLELLSGGVPQRSSAPWARSLEGLPADAPWDAMHNAWSPSWTWWVWWLRDVYPIQACTFLFHFIHLYTSVTVLPVLDAMNKWLYLTFSLTWFELGVISGNWITTSHSFPKDIVNLRTRTWFRWQVTPAIFFSTISNDECPCGVSVQTAATNHVVINMMSQDGISVFLFWLFYKLRKLKAHTSTCCKEKNISKILRQGTKR